MIRFAGVAIGALLVSLPSPQEVPRFRSTADAVRVDALVVANGRPVTGLQAADFELLDSGVPQAIEAVAIEDVPLNLLLALDTSSSLQGPLLQQLKSAAKTAVETLRPDDAAALLTFSARVTRDEAFTRDRAALGSAIDRMQADGPTALRDAVFAATALRERAQGRVVLLLFTDGVDTISWMSPKAVLDAAVRSDMVIYAVSTSDALYDPNPRVAARYAESAASLFLREPFLFPHGFIVELTERTGGSLLHVAKATQLPAAFARIVSEFRSRYLLTYSPRKVPSSGWHPIEVRVKDRRATVTARRGYWR